ncbi:Chloroperoxidase [Mycena rebaudengoi]|nr:Chloroperoxidase [Mycena rebaudengoi]
MKSFALLSLLVPALFSSGNAWSNIRAEESTKEIQDGQTGTLMVLPPLQTDTGTKRIPDADHPFIAPGPNDQRGPCPAMNTLANHGYISRNGITSFEEIIRGTGEAFNIERTMASGMAALNLLTRGNPFVNKISIGGVSPFVPPLPGKIDGPQTQGIQKHGRVEGDASISRSDVFIGDNRNFNQTLFDMVLQRLAKFGDDGPDGPATVFNLQTLIEMKRLNLESDQALDPAFAIPQRRLNAAFAAPSLFMTRVVVFANGTTKLTTKRIISSFFMNQTFPENWFRAAAPVMGSPIPGQISAALPQWAAGRNDENGVFVADPPAPAPFNISSGCAGYWDQLSNGMPGSLAHVRGIFKQNVDMLLGQAHLVLSTHISLNIFKGIMFNGSGCTEQIAPSGPTNV